MCCANLGLDAVESRIIHIVRKGNDTGAWGAPAGAVDEAFLSEDEGCIRGNLVDGRVSDLDPVPGQSVLHGGGDHHRGTHACVASDDDFGDVGKRGLSPDCGGDSGVLALTRYVILGTILADEQHCHHKGNGSCDEEVGNHGQVVLGLAHEEPCDDRAWGGRGNEAGMKCDPDRQTAHAPGNGGENGLGLHKYVWEEDFVDAAKEVDDDGARSRLTYLTGTEELVGK